MISGVPSIGERGEGPARGGQRAPARSPAPKPPGPSPAPGANAPQAGVLAQEHVVQAQISTLESQITSAPGVARSQILGQIQALQNRLYALESAANPANNTPQAKKPTPAPGTPQPVTITAVTAEAYRTKDGTLRELVGVGFQPSPSDLYFSTVNVWFVGYHGTQVPQLMASGAQSPVSFLCDITGETVTALVQAIGTNGQPAAGCAIGAGATYTGPKNSVSLSGVAGPPPPPTVSQALQAIPTGFQFTFDQEAGLLADQIDGYKVYRNGANDPSNATVVDYVKQSASNSGSVVWQDHQPSGSTFYYWLTAVNTSGLESAMTACQSGAVASGSKLTASGQLITADEIAADGSIFSRVSATAITSNQVDLTKAGVLGPLPYVKHTAEVTLTIPQGVTGHGGENIPRSGSDATTLDRAFAKGAATDPDTLDSVSDGTTYSRYVASDATSNRLDFGKALLNKYGSNLPRSGTDATTLDRAFAKVSATDPDTLDSVGDGTTYVRHQIETNNENIVVNGNFAAGLAGWALYSASPTLVSTVDPFGTTRDVMQVSGEAWVGLKADFNSPCAPGDTFVWDFWIKTGGAGNWALYYVDQPDGTFHNPGGPTAWTHVVVQFTIPSRHTDSYHLKFICVNGQASPSDWAQFTAISIRKVRGLDNDVVDGTTYVRYVGADATGNRLDFGKSLLNKYGSNLPRSSSDATTLDRAFAKGAAGDADTLDSVADGTTFGRTGIAQIDTTANGTIATLGYSGATQLQIQPGGVIAPSTGGYQILHAIGTQPVSTTNGATYTGGQAFDFASGGGNPFLLAQDGSPLPAFSRAPSVLLTPNNMSTPPLTLYASNITATGFTAEAFDAGTQGSGSGSLTNGVTYTYSPTGTVTSVTVSVRVLTAQNLYNGHPEQNGVMSFSYDIGGATGSIEVPWSSTGQSYAGSATVQVSAASVGIEASWSTSLPTGVSGASAGWSGRYQNGATAATGLDFTALILKGWNG